MTAPTARNLTTALEALDEELDGLTFDQGNTLASALIGALSVRVDLPTFLSCLDTAKRVTRTLKGA